MKVQVEFHVSYELKDMSGVNKTSRKAIMKSHLTFPKGSVYKYGNVAGQYKVRSYISKEISACTRSFESFW